MTMADVSETRRAYTVRLELVDEPGELLRALRPIAENGGNLLSVFHERGNLTPRGNIPVEVDIECVPSRFDDVVAGLRDAGVTVTRAGAEQYAEQVSVLLVGHLVDTDLSDTLSSLEECNGASVTDFSLDAPEGTTEPSSARVHLAVDPELVDDALATVREVASRKEFMVVEPLLEVES